MAVFKIININMLEKEFDYYLNNEKDLSAKYGGKYIVIVGENVVAAYPSYEIALFESKKTRAQGSCLIPHCLAGTVAYTSTFHSNVFLGDVTI